MCWVLLTPATEPLSVLCPGFDQSCTGLIQILFASKEDIFECMTLNPKLLHSNLGGICNQQKYSQSQSKLFLCQNQDPSQNHSRWDPSLWHHAKIYIDTHIVDRGKRGTKRRVHTLPYSRWAADPGNCGSGVGARGRLSGTSRRSWPEEEICDLGTTFSCSYHE